MHDDDNYAQLPLSSIQNLATSAQIIVVWYSGMIMPPTLLHNRLSSYATGHSVMHLHRGWGSVWNMHIHAMKCRKWADFASMRSHSVVKEKVQGIDYVTSTSRYCTAASLHLQHPLQACCLINQLVKKLVSLVTVSLVRCVKARSQKQKLIPP